MPKFLPVSLHAYLNIINIRTNYFIQNDYLKLNLTIYTIKYIMHFWTSNNAGKNLEVVNH